MPLLNLLFPQKCISCSQLNYYLCPQCINYLSPLKNQYCPICHKLSISGFTHSRCTKPLGLNGLTSLFRYSRLAKKLITKFKFKFITHLNQEIYELITTFLPDIPFSHQTMTIIPVPLHPKRLRWRGFNQAKLIANHLHQYLNWPITHHALKRIKHTPPQSTLSKTKRRQSLIGAFKLNLPANQLKNQKILLVDDVYTTGSTLKECTKVLRRNGASKVWGFTLARS